MKNLDEIKTAKDAAFEAVSAALVSGNQEEMKAAVEQLQDANKAELMQIHAEYEKTQDEAILAERGIKALTSEETKFWNSFITIAKRDFGVKNAAGDDPIEGGVYTGLMQHLPETQYESIVEELRREHPLLSVIDFKSTSAVTKWTVDNSAEQRAKWGPLNSKIEEELLGGPFLELDMTLCKLTAFMVVSRDMLDLGPRWVANYAITMLKESLLLGLEYGIVAGTGIKGEPIGMIRNLKADPSTETGYAKQTALAVTELTPEVYGDILAGMAVKDNGRTRKINSVILVINPVDYFKIVFPAVTGITPSLNYVGNIFPFPTTVIQSTFVDSGEAVIGLADDYFMGLGSSKAGTIESSDSARFFEDQRAYKTKLYGNGRPKQKSSFRLLDISGLKRVLPVVGTKAVEDVATTSVTGRSTTTTKA